MAERIMTLEEVNANIARVNIKGKPYALVNSKVMGFRAMYPEGRIVTMKMGDDGTRCDFRAEVWDGDMLLATGHAYELRTGGGPVNKTSYVENCETSAVGRALAFLGIGADTAIASAEEVFGAIKAQDAMEKLDAAKAELWRACKRYASQHDINPREHWDGLFSFRPLGEWSAEELLKLAGSIEGEVV